MTTVDPTAIPIEFDPQVQRMWGVAAHGMTPFDVQFISPIANNLFMGGCEGRLVLPRFIKHVVSLYRWERYSVEHQLDSFTEVTMYDSEGGVDRDQILALANWVNVCRRSGPTLVHCQAGLNRSGLVTATALFLDGVAPGQAIDLLRTNRHQAVLCNPTFEKFVRGLE